jgi:uncharacterized protein (UPF0332 family)
VDGDLRGTPRGHRGDSEADLILYGARAREVVEEVKLLFDTGHLRPYVNRPCCACFYAMSVLFLETRAQAGKYFVT